MVVHSVVHCLVFSLVVLPLRGESEKHSSFWSAGSKAILNCKLYQRVIESQCIGISRCDYKPSICNVIC